MLAYFYEIQMPFPKSALKTLSHIQSTAENIFLSRKFEHYYLFSVSLLQSFLNPNKTILGTIFPKPQAFIIEVAPCSKSWLGTALKKALMWWSFNHKLTLDRRASKYPYPWVPSFTCAQINSDNFLVIKLAKSTSGWRCAGTPLKR